MALRVVLAAAALASEARGPGALHAACTELRVRVPVPPQVPRCALLGALDG